MEPIPGTSESKKWSERLRLLKESLSVSWRLVLVVFVALLLIVPEWLGSFVADRISKASVKSFKFGGIEFERGLEKATDELEQAAQSIAKLESERDVLSRALADAQAKIVDSTLQAQLARVQSEIETSNSNTPGLRESLASTIKSSRKLLEMEPTKRTSPTLPNQAYCYQEDRLKDGPDRFSVHCHASKAVCEEARGPSKVRKQTPCELTDLSLAEWKPISPGWMGSSYQYSRTPFSAPFPQFE